MSDREWFNLHGVWFDCQGPRENLPERVVRQVLNEVEALKATHPELPVRSVRRPPLFRIDGLPQGGFKATVFPEALVEKPKPKKLQLPKEYSQFCPAFHIVDGDNNFLGIAVCLSGKWGPPYYFIDCTEDDIWNFEFGQWNYYKDKEEPEDYVMRSITETPTEEFFEIPAAHKYCSATSYYPDAYVTGGYSEWGANPEYDDPKYYRCDTGLDPYPRKAGVAIYRTHRHGGTTNRPGRLYIVTDMEAYHAPIDDNIGPQTSIRSFLNYYTDTDEELLRCFWWVLDESLGDINVCSNIQFFAKQVADAWDDEDYAYNCLSGHHHGGWYIYNEDAYQIELGHEIYSYIIWGTFDGKEIDKGSLVYLSTNYNKESGTYWTGSYRDWDQFEDGEFNLDDYEVINTNDSQWSEILETQGTTHTLYSGSGVRGEDDHRIERDHVNIRIYRMGENSYITLLSHTREDEEEWEYHMVWGEAVKQINDPVARYEWVSNGSLLGGQSKAHKMPFQINDQDVYGTSKFSLVRIDQKPEVEEIEYE